MFFYSLFVCDYLRSCGEHIFGSIATVLSQMTCCGGVEFLGGLNFKVKNFPHLNTQKHEFLDPFLTGQNFPRKTLHDGEAHM